MLRGAHASLVEQLARQVSLNPPPGMQQKPSFDNGYTQWMADAQPLAGNLPLGALAGSNESELSQRCGLQGCACACTADHPLRVPGRPRVSARACWQRRVHCLLSPC